MLDHWQSLFTNFAVVALVISVWLHGQFLFAGKPRLWRTSAFGLAMGLGAVASIALAIELGPGLRFDLRAALMGIAGFFGGPVSAVVAALVAAVYRASLGGEGVPAGIASIIGAAAAGTIVSMLTRNRLPGLLAVTLLTFVVAGVNFVIPVAWGALRGDNIFTTGVAVALTTMAATATSAFFIMRQRVIERERDLLHAAFIQSPDYSYVKDPDSKFVAVNDKVALYHSKRPGEMIGLSDHDLTPDRADALLAAEKQIVTTGIGFTDYEEELTDLFGEETWYSTSKVPLRDGDGAVIGIAGVTRDVTTRKGLERDLVESRNKLSYVLAEMSDGIAMFDRQGTLSYCNAHYSTMFPLTAEIRRPGQHLRDILLEVIATGEQRAPQPGHEEEWIESVVATLRTPSEEEVELFSGHWLKIRTRPTSDGSTLVVVADVTKLKEAEAVLSKMTEQLKLLATTDGLTGLTNRRAFDQALENEVSRCTRAGQPLSLLMIDVDKFKLYNDRYGHQGGDAVLKTVGFYLKKALKRPGDVAARYGGEEFAAILPNVDEDNAFFVADSFREALAALKVPHEGAERGYLTASVGLATFSPGAGSLTAGELIRRADEALYNAKEAGRDRVTGWRERFDVPAEQAKSRA